MKILFITALLLSFLYTSEVMVYKAIPLTIENVVIVLKQAEIQHVDIVLKQIKLETNYLQSKLALEKNNLFGFRANHYLAFDTWQESIYYYKQWQDKRYKGGDYYTFLRKVGYASDVSYISKLKKIQHKEHIKNLINN
ncbi:MAG: glucosaminidase domain-containing protein [Candidatus Saccharimonadaceae bacterium]